MAGQKHILLVDDDTTLAQMLSDQLVLHDEFITTIVDNGRDALAAVRAGHVDLVILDVGLPDMDGREVCRQMRRQGATMPVIMLTASDSDSDQILGLESGANDYVAKPFRFNVLLARIRAQLRQHEQSEDAVFTVGRYSFQPGLKLLVDSDSEAKIRLTEKETAILRYLYRAGKDPVSREVLLNEVWGYNSAVTTHTLETHIYRLRQKIEKDPARACLLVTDKGGYRLVP
jgi:DNA-binding response OmpR family regulator